jgi:hypothetical protein
LESFGFLQRRLPQHLLGLRVPAEVDSMQLLVVSEENDFARQLLLVDCRI